VAGQGTGGAPASAGRGGAATGGAAAGTGTGGTGSTMGVGGTTDAGGTTGAGSTTGVGGSMSAGGTTGAAGSMANGGSSGVGGGGAGGTTGGAAGGAGGDGAVHDRCADPQRLELVNGQVTVSDDTKRGTDEFPTLTCGGVQEPAAFRGPQLYYKFTVREGFKYELRIKAGGFSSTVLYIFPAKAACTADAIQAACTSGGDTGLAASAISNRGMIPFAPRDAGDYIVGIDTNQTATGPFTLTIFEYCGTAGAPGCKTKVCDADTGATCTANVRTICNADGTGFVTTDCTATGAICYRGGCQASVFDPLPNSHWTAAPRDVGPGGVTLLDFYSVSTSRTLTEIQVLMMQARATTIGWVIYEASTQAGPYQAIFAATTTSSATGVGTFESAGLISVPLVAGRFYALGVSLPAGATYQIELQDTESLPINVSFGQVVSATALPSASPGTMVSFPTPGAFVFQQRLTTTL